MGKKESEEGPLRRQNVANYLNSTDLEGVRFVSPGRE